MDLIEKKLISNIEETNKDKSSHWKKYLNEDSNFHNKNLNFGFEVILQKVIKIYSIDFYKKLFLGKKFFKLKLI